MRKPLAHVVPMKTMIEWALRWGANDAVLAASATCCTLAELAAKVAPGDAVWIATRPGVMTKADALAFRDAILAIGPSIPAMEYLREVKKDAWQTAYYTVAAFGSDATTEAESMGFRQLSDEWRAVTHAAMDKAWAAIWALAQGFAVEAKTF